MREDMTLEVPFGHELLVAARVVAGVGSLPCLVKVNYFAEYVASDVCF